MRPAAVRADAVEPPRRWVLSCDECRYRYNLTDQLLRIVGGHDGAPRAPEPERTPGLYAFTFDYKVGWPCSLVISKNAMIKYQLLFRHLFHCKHVERQLSASWLAQQATKGAGRCLILA